jgi:phage shock protein PspC (stress-responsive transcriptional regulator)
MNRVITIHLNGKAFQLEEAGFDALRAYLTDAENSLADNPDKAEILADLEQAVGEKCQKSLNSHKDVVTAAEIEAVLKEMGPVGAGETNGTTKTASAEKSTGPKRLYLIREGAILAGVCTGLAAYFNVDVVLVRIVFVILGILTGGAWLAVYIAMALLIPYAETGEQRAAAYGESFKAQDIVDRAKERFNESYERFTGNKYEWKKWRADMREKRREWRREMRHQHRCERPRPFFGFLSTLLAIVWLFALISLITTGAIFGWLVPAGIPLWVAVILLFLLYHIVTGPMKAARYHHAWDHEHHYDGWSGIEDSLGLLFLIIAGWFLYSHYPTVHNFVNDLPEEVRQWWNSVK